MPHDEKQKVKYRYAETEFTLYVLRVRTKSSNTTRQRYSPFIYICFTLYASTFRWPTVVNSFLAQGTERGKNKCGRITEQSKRLQTRKNFNLLWKSPSDNSCCFRNLSKTWVIYVHILPHFRHIRYWAGVHKFPETMGTGKMARGSSMLRTHKRQARCPECVPLVSDMVIVYACDSTMHDARH
jgi:hypothetical protein